ncbi:MAG: PD-(D/E)XK nuclease family protein [Thermoanaerobaculia bacterium]
MPRTVTERSPSRLLIAPDARAAERELLAGIDAAQAGDPLAAVVVVVPSHRLRTHLLRLLARRLPSGGARLGVRLYTLRGVARAIVEAAGPAGRPLERFAAGELLLPLFVERAAAREPVLARSLGDLDDGYAGIAGTVRDLYDAGFAGVEHLEAALELLEAERPVIGGAAVERAGALLRIALAARSELAALGLETGSELLVAASEALARDGERALPARRLFVHGFSDATGVASELLARLLRDRPTTVLLTLPPALDPTEPSTWRFGSRLRERFAGIVDPERVAGEWPPAPIVLRSAADGDREIREVVRSFVASTAGATPESAAIVARDLAPCRSALEREIDRQGLAASGADGSEHPAARLARAWLELLRLGGEAPFDLVLAAAGPAFERAAGTGAATLRSLAARAGARHLASVAALSSAGGGPAARLPHKRAKRLLAGLDTLQRPRTLGDAAVSLHSLLDESGLDAGLLDRLTAPLDRWRAEPLAGLSTTAEERQRLLADLWSDSGARPLGGDGGGVAILSVTEARGLTFDRLAVVGLARDRFPRRIHGDPMLPDALRIRLRALLPDLPVKSEGHDEERFLFAQLLVAARTVELSHPLRDGEGRELARSALLDELERSRGELPAAPLSTAPHPAIVLSVDQALADGALAATFADALREGALRFDADETPAPADDAAVVAQCAFQSALLDEYGADPADDARRDRLGPFFGFVGATTGDAVDPPRPPAVTAIEDLARCGWKTFLARRLRLEAPLTTRDEIPALPGRLAGITFHRVLDRLVPAASRGGTVAEALARPPVEVPWPDEAALATTVLEEARSVLREEGLDPELFALPLARVATALLAEVRAIDWAAGSRSVLAAEVEGEAEIALSSGVRTLRFRADRLDPAPAGAGDDSAGGLAMTDYKSSRPLTRGKKAETRETELARALAAGRSLQIAAYALARTPGAAPRTGRLLFARPGVDPEHREIRITTGDPALERIPWNVLLPGWERGVFLPRLLDGSLTTPPELCSHCEQRVACLQGDSGARLRLERWALHRPDEATGGDPERLTAEGLARALFALDEKAPKGKRPAGDDG